jgi:tetraacyldisaccharide 4'-kinase
MSMIRVASEVWSSGSWIARKVYNTGILKRIDLGVPVISVGNIQAGGAGKTPIVIWLANELIRKGKKVCILTRGYGGNWERTSGVLFPGEKGSALDCGDEAALIRDSVPDAIIGVSSKRSIVFNQLSQSFQADVVILDDGFQHHKIKKDVEIVALTSDSRSETVYRDWPSSLGHADVCVWIKGNDKPDTHRPLVKAKYVLEKNKSDAKFWLVTGVARGHDVRLLAENAGYFIDRHLCFPDHAKYSRATIENILGQTRQHGAKVLLTGKDWVKWREFCQKDEAVVIIEPRIEFESGYELLEQALEKKIWKK